MDRHLLEALLRLRSPELAPIVEWLRSRREAARDACTSLSGEALMRAQGKAGELKELLESISKAPELLDKLRKSK